ncbi:Pleiotropic negative transcriptional regulator, partial [Borealophlyctis nickersoniae]
KTITTPSLHVLVTSLSSFNRHVPIGYGHAPIPHTPGIHNLTIPTWHPIPATSLGAMQTYFLGAAPIGPIEFGGVPSEFEGNKLSKYGVKGETSGVVNVMVNVVHQGLMYQTKKLDKDEDINNYVLKFSAIKGHREVIKLLLANGVDININGGYVLKSVIKSIYQPVRLKRTVQFLLDIGAKAGEEIAKLLLDNAARLSAEHFKAAALRKQTEVIKVLVEASRADLGTLLHRMAQ